MIIIIINHHNKGSSQVKRYYGGEISKGGGSPLPITTQNTELTKIIWRHSHQGFAKDQQSSAIVISSIINKKVLHLPSTPKNVSSTLLTCIGEGSFQASKGLAKVCLSSSPTTTRPLRLPINLDFKAMIFFFSQQNGPTFEEKSNFEKYN